MEGWMNLGSAAGLVVATTLIVQFTKKLRGLNRVPVPWIAFVIGVGMTLLMWYTGNLTVPGVPEGFNGFVVVGIQALLTVVLPAMGAGSVLTEPRVVAKRGGAK